MPRMTHAAQMQFGAVDPDPSLTFADQVLIEMIGARAYALVQPWAEQVSDTTWAEKDPKLQYQLYPVSGTEVLTARRDASGQDVPLLGILMTEQPATINAIERELFKTAYVLEESLSVFRVEDKAPVPKISWLVLCRHRDTLPFDQQKGGGSGPVAGAATALGGTLVYPRPITITSMVKKPAVPFNAALSAQLAPITNASAAAPIEASSPAPASITAPERKQRLAFGLVGFGVLAALGAWVMMKSKRRR